MTGAQLVRYAPGGNPPGLRSPNWTVLKTWHRQSGFLSTFAACGRQLFTGGIATAVPEGAPYCSRCKALDAREVSRG